MTISPVHFTRLKDDLPHLAEELDRFVERLNAELSRIEGEAEPALEVSTVTFAGTAAANIAKFGAFHPCIVASGFNVDVWLPRAGPENLGQRMALGRMTSGGVFNIRPTAGAYINGVQTGISPSLMRVYQPRWTGDGATKGWRVDY